MKLAVIIPAYNEEMTIADVVTEFKTALPEAKIYVGDNNSDDATAKRAREAGAEVIFCGRQGKGFTIRTMFEEVDADIYVMVDGDTTYCASNVRELIAPVIQNKADMVIGTRKQASKSSFTFSHRIGNRILTTLINLIFRVKLKDVLSGYRIISRKMLGDLTLLARGFELEVELTIRALQEGYKILDMPIEYRHRPKGSVSKLSTWGDGFLILYSIITLFRDYNPMMFFFILSMIFFIAGMASGLDIFIIFLMTGHMYHLGLAIFTAICILLSAIIFFMGLLLDSLNNSLRLTQLSIHQKNLLIQKLLKNNSEAAK
ncbi:MAG: glycosyltransferase family 2 protein [candidate division KSB1 bacterium]|nr:glycosyltransferase family 2 protein [candidate division KSB1 bacterium]MDZ7336706.1 glycosyltransferase family 2 protein [candidate division KSB1 bacterium]MDZ7358535.1 glycosyltransferase family 2 protein [candidate division KSB1 bacterium]MDZ7375647.1 glycosyltransferase family 2 protein [candidate division KSB1 bacterium]MDZ7402217.1 glycosyltransferase family 2 protein [candidate division KSB1 bacterium]